MNLKDLDLVKLSKLTSDYTDELKCLECCKYYIAPATAVCGHALCHTCWRGRRTCPICASTLERKSLKLNLPLQALTNHLQTLGEAFEKLFNIKLDEFDFDVLGGLESDKDPDKNVKEWLTSSQNHFSAPIQNSDTLSQDIQGPNCLELSASNIIIHADAKKPVSLSKVTKVAHVQPPQDDWDKIEQMPDPEDNTKNNENIVGPMDIEQFFLDDNEYTNDNPRRSSRKRDIKTYDDSNQKSHDTSINKHHSRDSSCENDKKSQKGKQPWNNVKRMRKEFSKLNKKNRNKLNVSIEMVKKTQNVKPIINTPLIATQQVVTIDDNTPDNTDKENQIMTTHINDPIDEDRNINLSTKNEDVMNGDKSITLAVEPRQEIVIPTHVVENTKVGENDLFDTVPSKGPNNRSQSKCNLKEETKMPFIKKSALHAKNIEVTCGNLPNTSEQQATASSDDIEISIKIGNTITNILIKKKNDVQVKINTDREVQTSLGPHNLPQYEAAKDKNLHNVDINIQNGKNDNRMNQESQSSKSEKTLVTGKKLDKSTSEKKNTASADTGTAQFEITESVEKELSNAMEYETAKSTEDGIKKLDVKSHDVNKTQQVDENLENVDDFNDIFNSGSVKEANVQTLKEHAPSEILISTIGSKLRTQKKTEKRIRDHIDEEPLPQNKKVKLTPQQKAHGQEKSIQHDSEPINYDVIMGQVFANIDADMEDIRKSQDTENLKGSAGDNKLQHLQNTAEMKKNQIINKKKENNTQITTSNSEECYIEKHSENVFSILEKEDDNFEGTKNDKVQQVEELLTPVLCQNLDSSQESQDSLHKTNKSNKKSQDYDDSDRSVVEETPQKNLSFTKLKRASTSNLSQIASSESKKIPPKVSTLSAQSIINLTDTVTESNKSSRDVTVIETAGKKLTLETPLTISKFTNHITYKSTPVARKSLNFDKDNDENDPEQTLCPTIDVIAKTTQEKEFMSQAFERTPTTPTARPHIARNNVSKANQKFCLAGSCLTATEIANVKVLCAQRKWTYVDKYSKDITHLVVGVDEEKKSQRSVKYMCALAASKWIVSFDWIRNCLQSKEFVNEEYFEALDSTGEPGPRRSRIAKQKLFQGIKFYCMAPFSVLDADTLKIILVAAGGRVVKEMKEVKVSEGSSEPALLLAEPEHTQEDRFIYLAMEQSIVPVNFEWVLNCLGSYSLGSIQELLLCPSSLLPAATARWPEVLLAQDYD